MIQVIAGLLLFFAGGALVAESAVPVWNSSPAAAEASARSLGKPILLLWQTGPGAVAFTQEVERLFSSWPDWARLASLTTVFTRGRSWEASLPPKYPPLPDSGKSSSLVLWNPRTEKTLAVWTEVPPVLELSRKLAEASGRTLSDPYDLDVTEFTWDDTVLTRNGTLPRWTAVTPEGSGDWIEEGPLGSVVVLREVATGRRAAFPFENEWSYLYDPKAQSWTPWNVVLVKHR